jgi:hypothetical protein
VVVVVVLMGVGVFSEEECSAELVASRGGGGLRM